MHGTQAELKIFVFYVSLSMYEVVFMYECEKQQ